MARQAKTLKTRSGTPITPQTADDLAAEAERGYDLVGAKRHRTSQIEGTQSSLSDLLLFEHDVAPGVPEEDVRETNYLAALNLGLKTMEEGLPLSLRLLKQVHGELLRGTRGGETGPGEFRRIQNWLGGSEPLRLATSLRPQTRCHLRWPTLRSSCTASPWLCPS